MWETEHLAALDKRHLWHPFTQMKAWTTPEHEPLIIVEGEGAMVRDSRGREYIDGNATIWTNIHGHCHPRIMSAIRRQLNRIDHVSFLGTTNEPAILLAEKLCALIPGGALSRVFYTDAGSTAIEVAVKMAVQYWQLVGQPQRSRFVSFDRAYHGDTCGAASLGGVSSFFDRFAPVHFPSIKLTDLEGLQALSLEDRASLAAVIVEPLIQGAAGMKMWPAGMLRGLREWCDREGVLLILDEVMTGFGRTGKMFACEHEKVVPDFLCLAKGLTGGTLPLAATLTTEKIYEAFLGEVAEMKTFYYGHSYCGNPIACAAALASLEVFEIEKTLKHLAPKIDSLSQKLAKLQTLPWVGDVRQCGFIAGIDIRQASGEAYPWLELTGARICEAARQHGLLTRPVLDTLVLMPPLCITEAQLASATDALASAITEICA